jgi:hypothetical protein
MDMFNLLIVFKFLAAWEPIERLKEMGIAGSYVGGRRTDLHNYTSSTR